MYNLICSQLSVILYIILYELCEPNSTSSMSHNTHYTLTTLFLTILPSCTCVKDLQQSLSCIAFHNHDGLPSAYRRLLELEWCLCVSSPNEGSTRSGVKVFTLAQAVVGCFLLVLMHVGPYSSATCAGGVYPACTMQLAHFQLCTQIMHI